MKDLSPLKVLLVLSIHLLGEAVTTFQAQAYKELLPSGGPVKTQVIGAYDTAVEEQAQRVKDFMNYQIVHVMEEFDEELDQMLFYLPLAGSQLSRKFTTMSH